MTEERKVLYRLSLGGVQLTEYLVDFDERPEEMFDDTEHQEWARLENHQCPNCPYNSQETPYCPVALSVSQVLFAVDDGDSTEVVRCEVITPEREYASDVPYQKAISSLIGLQMASSGCGHFDFLRPMARMHLPFATLEETIVRNSAYFLFGGLFSNPEASIRDRLDELAERFQELEVVNRALISRVRSTLKRGDIHRNAIIVLSSFSQVLSMEEQRGMALVKKLFREYQLE